MLTNQPEKVAHFLSALSHGSERMRSPKTGAFSQKNCLWLTQCVSTSDVAKQYADKHTAPFVCMSDAQTKGRGQQGKQWLSPAGHLYFSVFLPLRGQPLSGLFALEVALSLLQTPTLSAIAKLARIGIKWPNDVVAVQKDGHFAKFSGILIEPVRLKNHDKGVVIGVGVNCAKLSLEHKQSIDQPSTSVSELSSTPVNIPQLAAEATFACIKAVEALRCSTDLPTRFFDHDVLRGRKVRVYMPQAPTLSCDTLLGTACGINALGALVVLESGTRMRHELYSGSVSVQTNM